MFAMTDNNHHNSGHIAVWVKAPPMVQEILVKSDSRCFFVPPYMGPKGWVGVRLDDQVNWGEVAGILKDGYLMSAPKKLGGRVPSAMDQAARMSDIAHKTTLNFSFENDVVIETGHEFRGQVSFEEE